MIKRGVKSPKLGQFMGDGFNKRFLLIRFLPNSNKGLSEVVTNLLIILLVLVAVGVVWVVVRNIISEGAGEVELGQFTFDLSIQSAYVNGSDIVVVVRRGVGGGTGFLGMNFIFTNETDSITIEKRISLQETGRRTFTFASAELSGIGAGDEVSVAPIYESGGEKIGGVTDSATISGTPPPGGGNGGDGEGTGGNGGAVCGDGTCSPTEDSFSCPADCAIKLSCDRVWNQTDINDGNECDGNPLPNHCQANCMCEPGFGPSGTGTCLLDPPLDTGIIFSVWNRIYFDSNNLPKSDAVTDFINDYVNFSSSPEVGCFLITFADYVNENDISYLRVDDSLGAPNIAAGQGYSVWGAENCGQ